MIRDIADIDAAITLIMPLAGRFLRWLDDAAAAPRCFATFYRIFDLLPVFPLCLSLMPTFIFQPRYFYYFLYVRLRRSASAKVAHTYTTGVAVDRWIDAR